MPPTSRRYERAQPGELVHLDIKKLARIVRPGHRITGDRRDTVDGAGWEYAHVAIDDCTRLAYAEVLPDEKGATSVGFLERAVAWFARPAGVWWGFAVVHLYFLGWMMSFVIHGEAFSDTEQYRQWAMAGYDPTDAGNGISPWVYPVLAQIPIHLAGIAGPGPYLLVWTLIVTVLNMRAPGMTLMKMPVFTWMAFVTQLLLVFALPVISVALFLLTFDRIFDGGHVVAWDKVLPSTLGYQRSSWAGNPSNPYDTTRAASLGWGRVEWVVALATPVDDCTPTPYHAVARRGSLAAFRG